MTAAAPVLEVDGLTSGYVKNVPSVKGCCLSVGSGEIVGILGANNAGKTTLIRAITGSLPVWSGRVVLAGTDVTGLPTERITRLGVGVALEGRRIFGSLSVEENLLLPTSGLPRSARADVPRRLQEIYDVMPDLWTRRSVSGSALSGGQQQMLAIGRAMITDPRLIVLDEPSLGLSPRFTEVVVELLKSINERFNTSILIAEQLVWIASELSSRVYVMSSGDLGEPRARGEWSDEQLSSAYLGHDQERTA